MTGQYLGESRQPAGGGLTGDAGIDDAVAGRKEKVWAIGPGAMYSFSQDDHLVFNTYFEQDVKNRPEGSRLQLRYIHHF